MAVVFVDGREVLIEEGERLNGIQAAARAGIEIPHYCWHPGLSVVASCRMCLVETGQRNPETGEVTMTPKVVPACQTPAKDQSVFLTDTPRVQAARMMVEEDLLVRHPIDCPICDKAGECYLQDYHFKYGREERRADLHPFTSRRRALGETVTLFVDRCVMCTRCVRFTREVSGTSELMVVNRGSHEEIDVFDGFPLDNKLSGNVVDLCPVGALGDVDFLYSQRVWFMNGRDSVCAGCATGCSIRIEQNQDRVYRIKPRENPHVNKWWMCDDGRYGWKYLHDARRITQPTHRDSEGNRIAVDWQSLPQLLGDSLAKAGRIAGVFSPFMTCEDAYMLAQYLRGIDSRATFFVGPIPHRGEDELYPGGLAIRAEKCPNRRGVEMVLRGFGGSQDWGEFLESVSSEDWKAIWICGGYPDAWLDDEDVERIAGLKMVVLQDLFPSLLSERADYCLPATAFPEREGTYVNATERMQRIEWAVRPPSGVQTEGRFFWRLLERPGLYNASAVRRELASNNAWFSDAAADIPPHGLDLMNSRLADATA